MVRPPVQQAGVSGEVLRVYWHSDGQWYASKIYVVFGSYILKER
jgi:hypothetical protein